MSATPDSTFTSPEKQLLADLRRQLGEREAELAEAREQQIATAEVLQVISSSPGNLASVFDAMLEKSMRLCEIAFGLLFTRDGEYFHGVAARGLPPALAEYLRHPFTVPHGSTFDELVAGVSVVQIPDIGADDRPAGDTRRALVELGGARTGLAVALRKDNEFLGAFWFYRQEVRPFTEKQIALLQNFAAQAVIAMENTRLITELRQRSSDLQESLEYQTATSDVLRVIGRSGGELDPVLQTLVETAARICIADGGLILRLRDGQYHIAASVGFSTEFKEHHARSPTKPGRGTVTGRVAIERRVVHVEDVAADPDYVALRSQELGQTRTMLGVPLFRDGAVAGVITLSRSRVEPFTDSWRSGTLRRRNVV